MNEQRIHAARESENERRKLAAFFKNFVSFKVPNYSVLSLLGFSSCLHRNECQGFIFNGNWYMCVACADLWKWIDFCSVKTFRWKVSLQTEERRGREKKKTRTDEFDCELSWNPPHQFKSQNLCDGFFLLFCIFLSLISFQCWQLIQFRLITMTFSTHTHSVCLSISH